GPRGAGPPEAACDARSSVRLRCSVPPFVNPLPPSPLFPSVPFRCQPFPESPRPTGLHSRRMAPVNTLGEFEQLLLLAVLRLDGEAYGPAVARELEATAGRAVSRGALYTSLDRLEDKGLLRWAAAKGTPARNGLPRRLYIVTPAGV